MATYTGADKAVGYLFTASNNTAAEYSSAATYAVGDFVIYEGTLYKCISAISSPEAWTPAHWTQTTIMENAGGGGGGGTTVIANPAGAATDTLNKLQVGATIYDIPAGGGGGIDYSETEQITGQKWIDGKTIYQKTIKYQVTGNPSGGKYTIPHNISNMETVILFHGIMNHSEVVPYGENLPSKDGSMGRVSVKVTNIEVSVPSGSWQGYIFVFTLQYTKSA
jgi:hypothetical protein